MKTINLCNTFEVVVPLWKGLVEQSKNNGLDVKLVISSGKYRNESFPYSEDVYRFVPIPKLFSHRKMFNHLFYSVLSPIKLIRPTPDLNVFFTQPPLYLIWGTFFSRLTKTPYMIHVMDFQPDFLVSAKILKRSNIFYKILNYLVTRSLKKADKVIVIGRCMAAHIEGKGVDRSKLELVENVCPVKVKNAELHTLDYYDLFKEAALVENSYVLYGGNMGRAHEYNTILDAAQELQDCSDLKIVFAGVGPKEKLLKDIAHKRKLKNIVFYEFLRGDEYAALLFNACCHFITLRPEYSGVMVPSKFYSSVASSRPVVYEGAASSEVALAIVEHDIGSVVEPDNASELATTLLRYFESEITRNRQIQNSLNLVESRYNFDNMIKNYCSILE